MASDELKEMRKNLTKEAVRDHQMATTGGTQTDLFTCGKCKGKCCTYTQVHCLLCAPMPRILSVSPSSKSHIKSSKLNYLLNKTNGTQSPLCNSTSALTWILTYLFSKDRTMIASQFYQLFYTSNKTDNKCSGETVAFETCFCLWWLQAFLQIRHLESIDAAENILHPAASAGITTLRAGGQ